VQSHVTWCSHMSRGAVTCHVVQSHVTCQERQVRVLHRTRLHEGRVDSYTCILPQIHTYIQAYTKCRSHLAGKSSPRSPSYWPDLRVYTHTYWYVYTYTYIFAGLYQVLQSHGEEVGPAWPIVLALIKGVAQDEEEQHVRQAFMCVQLVRNDLLSVLPVDCLQLLLTTIGSYGCQGIDQHTATHCNTLQHTTTHCNTLQ